MSFHDNITFFIVVRFLSGLSSAFVLIFGTSLILPSIQAFGKKSLSTAHFMGVGLGIVLSSILVSVLGSLGFEWDELWIGVTILSVILAIPIFVNTPDESIISTTNVNSNVKNNLGFTSNNHSLWSIWFWVCRFRNIYFNYGKRNCWFGIY